MFATNADYATTSGTSVFATNAGTAVYSTTSGSAVSITGSITRSQVSDYASGTVANISGTVTQAQVANLTTDLAGKANLAGGNSFTGAQVIATNGTANVGLIVRGTAGQSANLFEAQNSGSTVIARVDKNGAVSANYFGPSGAGLLGYVDWTTSSPLFQTGGTAVVGLRVRGAPSQSANLLELQTSDGVLQTAFSPIGYAQIGAGTNPGGQLGIPIGAAVNRGIVIRGAASQSADYLQIQTSAASTALRVTSTGALSVNTASSLGQVTVLPASTATVGVVVQGLSGQSANLQEWQSSTGSTAARVAQDGRIYGTTVTTLNAGFNASEASGAGFIRLTRSTAVGANPGANLALLYFRDGTNAGTLKLVVRAGAAGAETTILDNIPQ